jgi:hypothetical protein
MQDSEKYIFCNLKEASNYKNHPVDNLWVQPDASYFVYYLNTEIIAIYFLHCFQAKLLYITGRTCLPTQEISGPKMILLQQEYRILVLILSWEEMLMLTANCPRSGYNRPLKSLPKHVASKGAILCAVAWIHAWCLDRACSWCCAEQAHRPSNSLDLHTKKGMRKDYLLPCFAYHSKIKVKHVRVLRALKKIIW